jgi:hypothetical protein
MSDLQKATLQNKSVKNGYNTNVNGKYLYTSLQESDFKDSYGNDIHGRYFHYKFQDAAKFVKYFKVNTGSTGSTPTLAALYGKEEDTRKWRMLKALNKNEFEAKQKIDVYPLEAFQEYIFVILEISGKGSHNVSSVDIFGGPLIDPVKKHHAHFEHFSGMKKNVSFDESKNEIFVNNPRKFSKWIIPSALAIILTPFLYKKIKL